MTDTPSSATEPDELNPILLRQENSMKYFQMSNRIVQRNGGFSKSDEEHEETERQLNGGKKMSRFKAARIAKGT